MDEDDVRALLEPIEARLAAMEALARLLIARTPAVDLEEVARDLAARGEEMSPEIRLVARRLRYLLEVGLELDATRPLDEALCPEDFSQPE